MVPLWVYRRHALPSRGRRQHDVLALAAAPGVAAARAAAVPAAAAGVAAARGGVGPQEAIRPSRRWSRIVRVVGTGYFLMGRKQLSHGIQTGKYNKKLLHN